MMMSHPMSALITIILSVLKGTEGLRVKRLNERKIQWEGSLYIACNDKNAFFTSDAFRNYNL